MFLFFAGIVGCKTVSPSGSSVTASATFENATPAQMLAAAREVFLEAGYQEAPTPGYALMFEKPAGTVGSLLYGDFSGIWLRARLKVVELSATRRVLDCKATYVRNRGEVGIEDEQGGVGKGQFRDLLRKTSAKVQAATSTPP
jgi:hypothetical protein